MVDDEGIKKTAVSLRKRRISRASSLVFEGVLCRLYVCSGLLYVCLNAFFLDSDGKSFIP